MRKGFSSIEFIFVIVIIGIISATAVPKLAEQKLKGTDFEFIGEIGKEIRAELSEQGTKITVPRSVQATVEREQSPETAESDFIRGQ